MNKLLFANIVSIANTMPPNTKTSVSDLHGNQLEWFLLNHKGKFYIGYPVGSTVGKFFKKRPAVTMLTKGLVTGYVQPLFQKA